MVSEEPHHPCQISSLIFFCCAPCKHFGDLREKVYFSIPSFRKVLLAKQVPVGVVQAGRVSWATGWFSCGNSATNCLLNLQYGQISSRNHWDFSMELHIFIVPFSWEMTGNLSSICDVHWQILLFCLGKGDFLKFLFWKLVICLSTYASS